MPAVSFVNFQVSEASQTIASNYVVQRFVTNVSSCSAAPPRMVFCPILNSSWMFVELAYDADLRTKSTYVSN